MINTIYNEDCLIGLRQMKSKSIDLVVTDPPYMLQTHGAGIYKQHDKRYIKELENIKNGFRPEILDEICRVQKKINAYFFCSQKQIMPLLDYFVKGKGCNFNLLSWHKTNPVPACGNKYLTDTEFCLFFREKGVKLFGCVNTKKTFWVTPLNITDKQKWGHPTIKPLCIIEKLIFNSSQEGQTVLDPYIGSGTTAVACIRNKRNYVGFEVNKQYYETACQRIKDEQHNLPNCTQH